MFSALLNAVKLTPPRNRPTRIVLRKCFRTGASGVGPQIEVTPSWSRKVVPAGNDPWTETAAVIGVPPVTWLPARKQPRQRRSRQQLTT